MGKTRVRKREKEKERERERKRESERARGKKKKKEEDQSDVPRYVTRLRPMREARFSSMRIISQGKFYRGN